MVVLCNMFPQPDLFGCIRLHYISSDSLKCMYREASMIKILLGFFPLFF